MLCPPTSKTQRHTVYPTYTGLGEGRVFVPLGELAEFALRDREIHIWCIDLANDACTDTGNILLDVEMLRAERFVFERDRNQFVLARSSLRTILGRYLRIDPLDVSLIFNPHGKPLLEVGNSIGFNLSHSGDYAVLAVGTMPEIGIDIEKSALPNDVRQLAQSVFSLPEVLALDVVADDALSTPFLTCWTRKEAYLKAIGVGLTVDPCTVTVGTQPQLGRIVIDSRPDDEFAEVVTICQNNEYVVSLAVVGGFSEVKLLDYRHVTN